MYEFSSSYFIEMFSALTELEAAVNVNSRDIDFLLASL